jgi:phosphoglycolate phosphatase-like HAD superfamily hydrolase
MLKRDLIEAVLFDLDGTLMDTDDQTVKALEGRLRRLRWPSPRRMARRIVMRSETPANWLMTLLDMLGLDRWLVALSMRYRRRRGGSAQPDFAIIAGTKAMLLSLRSRYRLGIVTTRSAYDALAFLNQHGISDLFDVVVTRESTRRLKPHPAPILYGIDALGLVPQQCVMVGDTTVDIVAARQAGAWAIGVLCGFGERDELKHAGAHVLLESTADVSSVL